jgi:hypothetical protein
MKAAVHVVFAIFVALKLICQSLRSTSLNIQQRRYMCIELGDCNIPVFGVTKIEETDVCIAFMHRKSGEFSRFCLKLSK